MIHDFQSEEGLESLQADVCIVGAGAAGISVAKEFTGTPISVVLLEGGGPKAEKATQELYRSESIGVEHKAFDGRSRIFGGTTTLWAAQASPFDPIDFEERDWVPHSGWPIGLEDIRPYFKRVEDIMQVNHSERDNLAWPRPNSGLPVYESEELRFVYSQFSPQPNFAIAYKKELEDSKNVRVLLHANATHLHLRANSEALDRVEYKALSGKTGRVSAKYFILCCGGIETARLMLASNSVEAKGVGNRHDLVGRFFQDHIHMRAARVLPRDRKKFMNYFRSVYDDGGVRYCPKFASTENFQRREKLSTSPATFV